MAELAEIVCRFRERRWAGAKLGLAAASVSWGAPGRHKTCPYGDLMGLVGRDLAKHLRLDTCR